MMELTLHSDWDIPRDQMCVMNKMVITHPSTAMMLIHGCVPLWTRHMVGVREAERDRRRTARRSATYT
jgi:hypothetical protein